MSHPNDASTEFVTIKKPKSSTILVAMIALVIGFLAGRITTEGRSTNELKAGQTAKGVATIANTSSPSASPSPSLPAYQRVLSWTIQEFKVEPDKECGAYDASLKFVIQVRNLTAKTIVAAETSALITDLFDKELIDLNLPVDRKIGPFETALIGTTTGSSCFSLSQYDSDELRLSQMGDVRKMTKVIFSVWKIAYSDGSSEEF